MPDESPATSGSPPLPTAGDGPLRSIVGLFVVPLLVVLLCVGVFVGFGWIAYDQKETVDYLNDLKSWWRPRRAQAAYELSKILTADPAALDDSPGAQSEVRRLFVEAEDREIRQYLGLVLGRTRDREAVPLLIDALDDADTQTRIYALWSLGSIGDPAARQPLTLALRSDDPGVRKTAAFALGGLGGKESVAALRPLLEDTTADVRWNAALALARLKSVAGVQVLRRMVDRSLLAQVPGITPEQQEQAMIGAVRALAAIDRKNSTALFENLSRLDPSLKVRQAAIEAQRTSAESL